MKSEAAKLNAIEKALMILLTFAPHNQEMGTLEISDLSQDTKEVTIRLFDEQKSKIKVFLADDNGRFIKDITQFESAKGKSDVIVKTNNLEPGMYYLYLAVNKDINHLQELLIE